jgi:hypothetical protein
LCGRRSSGEGTLPRFLLFLAAISLLGGPELLFHLELEVV